MPSGDAQRVWFPEMIEALKAAWSPTTTWAELADLCGSLTELRKRIRQSRGIQAPLTRCPRCGSVSRGDISGVSVRSALFALKKCDVLSEADFKRLDRDWNKHRAAHGLDAYGRKPDALPEAAAGLHPPRC
jgi:hypothetical protein